MIIAFTGGRDYTNRAMVKLVCDLLMVDDDNTFVVGDCPTGADALVREIIPGDRLVVFYASWEKHGKAAGPIRNREMLLHDDLLVAFPGGKGTADCVRQARTAQIPVVEVPRFDVCTLAERQLCEAAYQHEIAPTDMAWSVYMGAINAIKQERKQC